MKCGCVIEPGCTKHTKPWVEPGVTSQGGVIEEAPESIKIEFVSYFHDGVRVLIRQGAAFRERFMYVRPATYAGSPTWCCLCDPGGRVWRVERNLYQVWLSARRHFWSNHADKGAA